jgi:uncharacterized protein YifE (UPF0438 family)
MEDVALHLRRNLRTILVSFVVLLGTTVTRAQRDPLPSWNNGEAKKAIVSFVKETTEKSSPKYVEPKDRIATFDQDGPLWTEQPLYAQAMFALDRRGKLAPQHPEWKETEPFKAVLSGDREAMAQFTEKDWMEIMVTPKVVITVLGDAGGANARSDYQIAGLLG